MRVGFGTAPEGEGVKGSQSSPNIKWNSQSSAVWDAGLMKWRRAIAGEVGNDQISRGSLDIGSQP
jgi:hypothetical protein